MSTFERNAKGQFVKTTNSTRYKAKQHKGKRVDEHRLIFCKLLGIDDLPNRKIIVHHINGDTKDNDINNLALMTITAHNRLHSHNPWNKGLTCKTSKKWADTHKKAQKSRFKTFLPKFKETFELRMEGKKLREIALLQGISREQVSHRLKKYKQIINS